MAKRIQILLIFIFVLTLFSVSLSFIKMFQKKESFFKTKTSFLKPTIAKKGIAKLTLKGMIHDEFMQDGIYASQIVDWLDAIRVSESILGLLIEYDSPGGEVGATKKIYDSLKELRKEKPIVSYTNSICTSGCYYLASISDRVLAQESAIIGSIGVIIIRPNINRLLDKIGISIDILKAGSYKDFSYPFRELTEDEKKMYEEILDTSYNVFISDVSNGRKQSIQTVKEQWAEGRIFSGRKAKALQLIDDLGGEKEAIHSLKLLLKITEELPIYEPEEDNLFFLLKLLSLFTENMQEKIFLNHQVYYLFPNSQILLHLKKSFIE
ncbi:MAG: signal peptide peptidase SppA [Leptonema sp. (in: bacteria)]